MAEMYTVDCPGCGTTPVPISVAATGWSRHCGCGVWYRVDTDAQEVAEWGER